MEEVPVLLGACAVPGAVELDLSELISADPTGIEALQRVRERGASLSGVPGFIRLKLDMAGAAGPPGKGWKQRMP